MSYILDALQRADAERTRGGVPTLHARPISGPVPNAPWNSRQRLGLATAGVVALGAMAVAWWLWQQPAQHPGVVVAAQTQAAAPEPVPPPATLPIAPIAPIAPTAAASPVAKVAHTATPVPAPPAVLRAMPADSSPKGPVARASAAPAAQAPTPTPSPAPLLSELPEAIRRQVPTMAITGAVNSDNPSQRLLLVNGQVLNQGSQVAPDLTVVEIRSGSSEFNFRGTRFRMAH